jgi:hypothetical protein
MKALIIKSYLRRTYHLQIRARGYWSVNLQLTMSMVSENGIAKRVVTVTNMHNVLLFMLCRSCANLSVEGNSSLRNRCDITNVKTTTENKPENKARRALH